MEIKVNSDTVSLKIDGTFTAEELRALLGKIGEARAQLAQDPANLAEAKVELAAIVNPAYWTELGPHTHNHSMLALRHPGFGWLGFMLPAPEAARLAGYLGHQVAIAVTATGTTGTHSAADPNPNIPTDSTPSGSRGGGFLH